MPPPTRRCEQKLIENIVEAVAEHGYDGVDIDWEPLQDSDEAQFTAFIRELRAQLDAVVPAAMLTAAVPFEWGILEAKNTTSVVASVIDELDFIHLMTYALAGPWGGWVTWHSSALFKGGETFPKSSKELPSAALMVEDYAAAGVPYDKMTLGLAFFGKIWQGGAGHPDGWRYRAPTELDDQAHHVGRVPVSSDRRAQRPSGQRTLGRHRQKTLMSGSTSLGRQTTSSSPMKAPEHQGEGPLRGRAAPRGSDDQGAAR